MANTKIARPLASNLFMVTIDSIAVPIMTNINTPPVVSEAVIDEVQNNIPNRNIEAETVPKKFDTRWLLIDIIFIVI